jgi:hypothetical protein
MIGPVSGTGRAMMASLQQAIEKGMPPDQAVQYVKSMATQGVAPLTDLYSMLNQFQRLKQQQVKPPQTPPTIKDQLNILDQQQQMQRDTTDRSGGLGGLGGPTSYAGQQEAQPMDRGLGAIDAGRMEYPQFAGGGIVAFAGGGDVIHMANGTPPSVFERLGESIGTFGNLGEVYGAQSMAAPVNPMGREISLAGISLEEIAPQFEKALAEGDQERADALSAALSRTERGRALETNIRNKVVQARRAQEAQARQQGALGFVRNTPPPPAAGAGTKPPATGGQRPSGGVQLGGGDYGDFSKGRKLLSDIETQLKPEAEKTLEQRLAEIDAIQAKQGIGEASRKQGEYLTKREAEAAKDLAGDKRMALAQAGFAMAEAASRRGRERTGFLGAAAIGGTTGTKLYQAALKENRALKDSIAQNRFALEQANELRKTGNIRDANALEKEAKSNLRSLNLARAQNETAIAEFQGRERGADRRLGAQLSSQEKRYAQAAQIAQSKLMQGALEQAPILIPGFSKLSREEQTVALQQLLGALAGGSGAMTGLGTIEGIEEE